MFQNGCHAPCSEGSKLTEGLASECAQVISVRERTFSPPFGNENRTPWLSYRREPSSYCFGGAPNEQPTDPDPVPSWSIERRLQNEVSGVLPPHC
jgi:hypothetical protein